MLNDFDLAIVESYSGITSFEKKTGTIPYMAYQLLMDMKTTVPRPHIYGVSPLIVRAAP